jgi:hypothetical protein
MKTPRTIGFWRIGSVLAATLLGVVAGVSLVVYSGFFNIAADVPHSRMVHQLLETVRDHSIAVRAKGVSAPKTLDDPKRIARGAGQYDEMCAGCHLAPGMPSCINTTTTDGREQDRAIVLSSDRLSDASPSRLRCWCWIRWIAGQDRRSLSSLRYCQLWH